MSSSKLYRDNWVTVPTVRGGRMTHYGVRTHFIEAGDGQPIVLLHGGTGSGESAWAETVPGLAGSFRAIGVDQIGFGYTDKPFIDSFQMMVDHVAGVIDTLGFERVGLVGQSTGAYIAAKYTCDYPDRVFGLAMINTATVASAMDVRLAEPSEGMRVMRAADTWTSREGLLRSLDVLMHNKAKITDDLVDYKLRIQALPGWIEARRARDEYRKTIRDDPNRWQLFNLIHRLPYITVPSALIWGIEDRFALVELGRRLHELLPRTAYHEVADGSHHCFRDVPDAVNAILLDFFNGGLASQEKPVEATVV